MPFRVIRLQGVEREEIKWRGGDKLLDCTWLIPFVMNFKVLNFNHRLWACSIHIHFESYNDSITFYNASLIWRGTPMLLNGHFTLIILSLSSYRVIPRNMIFYYHHYENNSSKWTCRDNFQPPPPQPTIMINANSQINNFSLAQIENSIAQNPK